MAFVAPVFLQYPQRLGQVYTAWLYGDHKGNPNRWQDPDLWEGSGVVTVIDQEMHFNLGASTNHVPFSPGLQTVTQAMRIGEGQNIIIFSRAATVVPHTPDATANVIEEPDSAAADILVRQVALDGQMEIEGTSVSNVFGSIWWPHKIPVPMMVDSALQSDLSLCNFGRVPYDVFLSWKIAILQTGR